MSTVWEIRDTGMVGNGGGYNPARANAGTDYTQQDSPHIAYTDILVGSTGADVTSASQPFTVDLIGNYIYTNYALFNQGFYEITDVNSGVATLSAIIGSPGATGSAKLGGAIPDLLTLANPYVPVFGPNDTAYMKGTFNTLDSFYFSNAMNGASVIGYGSVRGDNGKVNISTTVSGLFIFGIYATNTTFKNLSISATSNAGFLASAFYVDLIGATYITNCDVNSCETFVSGRYAGAAPLIITDCNITNCSTGIENYGVALVRDCYFNNLGKAIYAGTDNGRDHSHFILERCIFSNITGYAITDKSPLDNVNFITRNCDFYNNSGDLISRSSSLLHSYYIENSIFFDTGNVNISMNSVPFSIMISNAFGPNPNGRYDTFTPGDDIEITSNPFNNPSSGDFTLIDPSLKGVGTSSLDLGAIQSAGSIVNVIINKTRRVR